MSHAILHIDAGLAIYLLFQIALGTRRGSLAALAVLAQLVAYNELMNRLYFGNWRVGGTLRDMALTLLWPTLLVLVNQFRRWRWRTAQSQVRPKFVLRLAPAPEPLDAAIAPRAMPRQPPRLRVFPGYAKRGPRLNQGRDPG